VYLESNEDQKNEDYLCFWDYCCMNPVSHDTKKVDYTFLREEILSTGNEANYNEKLGTVCDHWCVSVCYDQIDAVYVYHNDRWSTLYKNGEKKLI